MRSGEGMLKRRTHEVLFFSGLMILFSISQALAHERVYLFQPLSLIPLLFINSHKELIWPENVSCGHGDSLAVRSKQMRCKPCPMKRNNLN